MQNDRSELPQSDSTSMPPCTVVTVWVCVGCMLSFFPQKHVKDDVLILLNIINAKILLLTYTYYAGKENEPRSQRRWHYLQSASLEI